VIARVLSAALVVAVVSALVWALATPALAIDRPHRKLGIGPVLEMTGTDESIRGDPWIGIDEDGHTQVVFAITIGSDTLIVRRVVIPGTGRLATWVLMDITSSTVPPEDFRVDRFYDDGSLVVAHGDQVMHVASNGAVSGPLTAAGADAHVGIAFDTIHVISTVSTPNLGAEIVSQTASAATFSALSPPVIISRRRWDPASPPPLPRGSQQIVVRSIDVLRAGNAVVVYDFLELAARIGVARTGIDLASIDADGNVVNEVLAFVGTDAQTPIETSTAVSRSSVLYLASVVTLEGTPQLFLQRFDHGLDELPIAYRGPVGLDAARAGANPTPTNVGVQGHPGAVLWSGRRIRRPVPTHHGGVFLDRIATDGRQVYRARILRARRDPLPSFSVNQFGACLVAWTTGRSGKRNRLRLRRVTRTGRLASEVTVGARVDPSRPVIASGDDTDPPRFAVAWTARTRRSDRRRLFVVRVESAD